MLPISGVNIGIRPSAAAGQADEASKVQNPKAEEKERESSLKPIKDEYIPEEKNRSRPGKTPDDKVEERTCNTDKVDREIEKLKRKKKELEQKINSETDENKVKELEKKLAQVESELKQKDNDAYRFQHATFS